jgi:hypothetical protein
MAEPDATLMPSHGHLDALGFQASDGIGGDLSGFKVATVGGGKTK